QSPERGSVTRSNVKIYDNQRIYEGLLPSHELFFIFFDLGNTPWTLFSSGDWKVPRTRRLESLRYRSAHFPVCGFRRLSSRLSLPR
ncbi:MAG: hypothetical protein JWQ04_2600, partial [Pedosphaera sp.]|nr:hypothetical protein [Pedosphaera sp.]